jgi:hypothetical protein
MSLKKLIEILKVKQKDSPSYIVKGVFQDAILEAEQLINNKKSNNDSKESSAITIKGYQK